MDHFRGHLLLFLAVTVGSAIPFVPTGEMVSGSSALAAHSRLDVLLIFLVTWLGSVLGDTLLLLEARLGARKLRPWLARRKYADRVAQAEAKLHNNAFSAIITGRLIPGGRAPVIIALGLGRYSRRKFLIGDIVACGLWAAIYSTIGSIGGRVASHPIWGIVIAIAFAVCMSVLVQQLIKLIHWLRNRHADEATRRRELESRSDLLNDLTYFTDTDRLREDRAPTAEQGDAVSSGHHTSRPQMRTVRPSHHDAHRPDTAQR